MTVTALWRPARALLPVRASATLAAVVGLMLGLTAVDAAAQTLSISIQSGDRVDEGGLVFGYVSLSEAVAGSDVTVNLSTANDDTDGAQQATSGTDYEALSSNMTITAGATESDWFFVTLKNDDDVEGPETFKLTISEVSGTPFPTGVEIGTASVVIAIRDGDSAEVSVEAASAYEGVALSFTVELTEAQSSDVVLGWSTGDDDTTGASKATAGTDYTAVTSGSVTIAANQTTATLTVQTTEDTEEEGDETLKVTITGTTLPAGLFVGASTAVGTIINNAGLVSFEDASATEGSPVTFTVRLSRAQSSDVVLGWSTEGDGTPGAISALPHVDYTWVTNGSVTIAANQTTATLAVQTAEDSTVEPAESFLVRITGTTLPDGVFIQTETARGIILDADGPKVSVEDTSATEGAALSFAVRLTKPASSNVVLGWSTGDDDTPGARQATSGTDYTAETSGSLTITQGASLATFEVQTTDDMAAEGHETLKVTITGTGVDIQTGTAVGTILDDDAVLVSVEAAPATEGTALSFAVRLSQAASSNVVLGWSTGDDDTAGANRATAGTDYTAVTGGSVTIAANQTTATLTVQTTNDSSVERDETLKVTITGTTLPAGVVIQTATAVGTIVDDDAVRVSVGPASATEGSPVEFVVTLSEEISSDVTVNIRTIEDDTPGAWEATEGLDYDGTSTSTTVPAGQTVSAVYSVNTLADDAVEGPETFKVIISERDGAPLPASLAIGTATAVGTILDEDSETVSVEAASATEGAALSFTVRLSEAQTSDVVLGWSTGGDDTARARRATAGTDYTAVTGSSVTIAASQTTATLTVQTTNDSLMEGDETLRVTITGTTLPTGVFVGAATAVGTILDDDRATVSVEAASATEGSPLSFAVRLSEAVSSNVVLGWSTGDDDTANARQATAGTDYTEVTSGSVTIAANQTTATLTVQTTGDSLLEGNETLKVTITGTTLPTGVFLGTATAVGTIVDDDTVTVSVEAATATEGLALSFTVRLSKAVSSNVVLGWSTGDDDTANARQATAGTDYTEVTSGSVTITASQTSGTLTVQTTEDTAIEDDETFKVTITGTTLPAGVTIATATAVGTILDDDAVTVSVEAASATEGAALSFTVRLSEAASSAVVLGWSTGDDDTANARQATAGADYTAVTGGSVTIAASQTTATLTVQTTEDTAVEGDETLKVTITGTTLPADVRLRTTTAVGTIEDDDAATVSVAVRPATEGTQVFGRVVLSTEIASNLEVNVSTGDDDTAGARPATAGTDYTAKTTNAIILAGRTVSNWFWVDTLEDDAVEGDETFKVTITGTNLPAGVTIATATAVATIVDEDTVRVSVEGAFATEGSPVNFKVRLSKAASSAVVLGWSTGADDTTGARQATAGTDYTAVTGGSVTIAQGQTLATLTVQTTEDTAVEGDETLKVTITGTTLPAEAVIQTATAVGTILEDDGVSVSVEAASATEGTALSFKVRLSKAASSEVVLGWSTGDGTTGVRQATAGTDYTAVTGGSVTIAQGRTLATLTVRTTDDTALEGDETLRVTITGTTLPTGVFLRTTTAVGTIEGDDGVRVSFEAASATEGTALLFPVRLSKAASERVFLTWLTRYDDTVDAREATAGTDYTAVTGGRVTIDQGQTSATLTVQTTDDTAVEGDETLQVILGRFVGLPTGVFLGATTAVGTILEDDGVRVSVAAASATEGTALSFAVRLSQAASSDVVLGWSTRYDDTAGAREATAGTDYTAVTGGSATIAASQTSATLTVQTTDDTEEEGDETLQVTITGTTLPTDVFLGTSTAVGTIVDDEAVTVSPPPPLPDDDDGGEIPPPPPPPKTVPGAPRNLSAVGGDGQAVLSWSAPEDDGGAPITDYEYRIDSKGDWISIGSTETQYTVSGLKNGAEYIFQVRAVNEIGAGGASRSRAEVGAALEFTHFANGDGIASDLVFVNVGTRPVRPALYFYDSGGEPIDAESVVEVTADREITKDGAVTVRTQMEPLAELTVSTHGRGELLTGSVRVTSGAPLGGGLRFDFPHVGVAMAKAATPISDAIFLARRREGGINTAVAIHNREKEPLEVSCRLLREGVVLEHASLPLAANGQVSWTIDQAFPAVDTSDFAGAVRCDAVERRRFSVLALEVDPGGGAFTTLPVFPVNEVPSGSAAVLDFAHFANGDGAATDLVLVHVGTWPSGPALTPVHTPIPPMRPAIYFYDTDGNPIAAESVVDVSGDLEVQQDGGLTVLMEMEPLTEITISTHGRGPLLTGSVRVVSGNRLGGMLRFDLPHIGEAVAGAGAPIGDAIFPVRRREGGINTAVAIHNLDGSSRMMRCELLREGVLRDVAMITLAANGQSSWTIDQAFPATDLSDFSGSLRCADVGGEVSPVGGGSFTVVALESDPGAGAFTTLPVFPLEKRTARE